MFRSTSCWSNPTSSRCTRRSAGDASPDRRARVQADEADRVHRQHGARPDHRRGGAGTALAKARRSRAPGSTCSSMSPRCRARCAGCRTSCWPRISAARSSRCANRWRISWSTISSRFSTASGRRTASIRRCLRPNEPPARMRRTRCRERTWLLRESMPGPSPGHDDLNSECRHGPSSDRRHRQPVSLARSGEGRAQARRSRAAHGEERRRPTTSSRWRATPTPSSSPTPSCPVTCCASSRAARRSAASASASTTSTSRRRRSCGITVTYVPDYCLHEVSDHAMALLLALARKIPLVQHAGAVRAAGKCRRWCRSIV